MTRWLLAATSVLACSGLACSAPADDADESADEITTVNPTRVKFQILSTCWLYATTGWAEILHDKASGERLNLSEAYLAHWHWFEQLVAAADAGTVPKEIEQTGDWGIASRLTRRYGLMREFDFDREGAALSMARAVVGSDVSTTAVSRVDSALKHEDSPLRRAMARRDHAAILRELGVLWRLPNDLAAELFARFGQDGSRTFDSGNAAPFSGGQILDPTTFVVATLAPDGSGSLVHAPILDVMEGGRVGWQLTFFPAQAAADSPERRAFDRRIQRVLNAGAGLYLRWPVDDDHGWTLQGRFVADGVKLTDYAPLHASLITDYQAEGVPGFGTLAAGQPEVRPDALAASLDPRARVVFYRIKNSWGYEPGLLGGPPLGYNDLTTDYLYLWGANTVGVALPPGY